MADRPSIAEREAQRYWREGYEGGPLNGDDLAELAVYFERALAAERRRIRKEIRRAFVGLINEGEARAMVALPAGSWVIHGGATGADSIADTIAWALDFAVATYPAEWRRYGYSAGPRRNRVMRDAAKLTALKSGRDVVCLAFPLPRSVGTLDMIRPCEAEGWEVRRHGERR